MKEKSIGFFISTVYQDGYNSTLGGEDNPSNHEEIVKKEQKNFLMIQKSIKNYLIQENLIQILN